MGDGGLEEGQKFGVGEMMIARERVGDVVFGPRDVLGVVAGVCCEKIPCVPSGNRVVDRVGVGIVVRLVQPGDRAGAVGEACHAGVGGRVVF